MNGKAARLHALHARQRRADAAETILILAGRSRRYARLVRLHERATAWAQYRQTKASQARPLAIHRALTGA
tara:strand:+ start:367 stop:579 length:213 start_codon:yes stop_codon:yes gene_type:complete